MPVPRCDRARLCKIGALIIRIRFGVYSTITIIRNHSIGNYLGSYIKDFRGAA